MGRRFDPDRAHKKSIYERLGMQIRVKSLTLIFFSYLVAIVFNYGKYVQGDFAIYFAAGQRINSGQELYESQSNLYVYGPLLAHILSTVSNFDEILVSRLWLILSIFAINLSAFLICRVFIKDSNFEKYLVSMVIMNIGFAARNNLGNGNVMAFVLLAAILVLYLIREKEDKTSSLLIAALTLFIFEVKTYLALFLIFYLVILKSFKVLTYLIGLVGILNVIYFFASSISYFDWIQSLVQRSKGIERGSDQATYLFFINAVSDGLTLKAWILSFLVYTVLLGLMIRTLLANRLDRQNQALVLLAAAPVITIFSHGQDFIFSTLVLVAVTLGYHSLKSMQYWSKIYFAFAIGLLINWTNEQFIPAVLIHSLLVIALISVRIDSRIIIGAFLLNASSTFILHMLLNNPGDVQYQAYNLQALLFGTFTFLLATKFRCPKERLEA